MNLHNYPTDAMIIHNCPTDSQPSQDDLLIRAQNDRATNFHNALRRLKEMIDESPLDQHRDFVESLHSFVRSLG